MDQINKYIVSRVGTGLGVQTLTSEDQALIPSYSLGNTPFIVDKYQLNASIYTLDSLFLEKQENIKTYSILGTNQKETATEITVDPVQDVLNLGYLGDVQIEYQVTNNLFSPSHSKDTAAVLFIREISLDRTEIRATSTTLTENELQIYAQNLYEKLNLGTYFNGATLQFIEEDTEAWCVNVMTEVINSSLVVTFKTYKPLPDNIKVKSKFTVLEQIGQPIRFEVVREVEIVDSGEDSQLRLKGPNFDVRVPNVEVGTVTDYLNYEQLFSYPNISRRENLYSIYKEQGIELSIDHSNFSNFIHFSSAAERLENFRYKLSLIKQYEQDLEKAGQETEKSRIKVLLQGIIENFDHYDRYLYFEKTDKTWPKASDDKPYVNLDPEDPKAVKWFSQRLQEAHYYDEHNPDILINTIPLTIRLDSRNEPYLIFVHMVGQQFDDEWVYIKAVSERFKGDNRLDYGISKDLVREALRGFGVELETTNQNLEEFFNLCRPGELYNVGEEISVTKFKEATLNIKGHNETIPINQITYDGEYAKWLAEHPDETIDGWYAYWDSIASKIADGGKSLGAQDLLKMAEFQPVLVDNYRKEIYKRIYHNIPLLLKTKGTSRGLRALISCFGIPDDLLEISVLGGANLDQAGPFFGPQFRTTSSLDRIRLDETGSIAPLMFDETTGTFITGTVLSETKIIQQDIEKYQKGTNDVEVGFRLNNQFDTQVKNYFISNSIKFDYDDLIGDPRNIEENYGTAFSLVYDEVVPKLRDSQGNLQIRTPSAVLRLIRYYDSALFRTLQAFVPARDVVYTGAIIDDNLLHRNRYIGVQPETNLGSEFEGDWNKTGSLEHRWVSDLTASIETVFIDGGEGGSLKVLRGGRPAGKAPQIQNFVIKATSTRTVTESRECPTVNYLEEDGQTVGFGYEPKIVFDDSPKFTGELSGSVKEITNGELNEDNIFKQAGSTSKTVDYVLDYRFLCLPRFPVDTVLNAEGLTLGVFYPIDVVSLTGEDFRRFLDIRINSVRIDPKTIIVNEGNTVDTEFNLVGFNDIRNQGWVLTIDDVVPDKAVNYIGMETDNTYLDGHEESEYNRVFTTDTVLLPAKRSTTGMEALLAVKWKKQRNLWNNFLTQPDRKVYARILVKDQCYGISIQDSDIWDKLVKKTIVSSSFSSSLNLIKTTNLETGEVLSNPYTVFQQAAFGGDESRKLVYIYVHYREGGMAVIDFIQEVIRIPNEDGPISDYELWGKLKGYDYERDPWAVDLNSHAKTYLESRYLETDSVDIIGVVIQDQKTGVKTTLQEDVKLTLLEPYMGCPWAFGTAGQNPLSDYQLLIEDWVQ